MTPDAIVSQWRFEDSLLDYKADWEALIHNQNFTPFKNYEWFLSALQWQPPHSKVVFWCAFKDKKLIGIMPLSLHLKRKKGLSYLQLEWLRVPDQQDSDIIADEALKQKLRERFISDLSKADFKWDKLELYPLSKEWGHAAPTYNALWTEDSLHPWICIGPDWNAYYQTRSRRLKKGNNHIENRLQEYGHIRLEQYTNTDNVSLEQMIFWITNISSNSWKNKTKTTFNHKAPRHFFETLTKYALKRKWLSLWILFHKNTPIAYEYQLIHNNNVHALRSDFDESYSALSPGSYLNWKSLERLASQGPFNYYMGTGMNDYKMRWSNQSIAAYRLQYYNQHLKSTLLKHINSMLSSLNQIKKWLFTPNKEVQT